MSLPKNDRSFLYAFVETSKLTSDGYRLFNYVIKTDDNHSLLVAEYVELL